MKVKVISEIGINHNGQFEEAKKLIKESFLSGCNGIKFQYRNKIRAYYSKNANEIGDDLLKSEINRCYIKPSELIELSLFAKEEFGLKVGISFFTEEDIDDFKNVDDYFDFFKVPSVEFANRDLIKRLQKTEKLLFISLGCQKEEVIKKHISNFDKENTILMHCVSNYPVEIYNSKLGYIAHLKNIWGGKIGYSSHDKDWRLCISALTLGIDYLERHITSNKNAFGLDHSTSSTPEEFKDLCYFAREIPLAVIGKNERNINAGELINMQNLGRSPYLKNSLPAGKIISKNDFAWRSPQVGLDYNNLDYFGNKKLIKPIEKGEVLCKHHFQHAEIKYKNINNWIIDKKISLPVRLHDCKKIEKAVGVKYHELHLSYSESLSNDLLNSKNYNNEFKYSIHLPDYIDSNTIIDPFSEDVYVREKSLKIIDNCIKLAKILNTKTNNEIPIVGSFSNFYKTKENTIKKVNNFCKEKSIQKILRLMPQFLPPIAWYFGGSYKLNIFNSMEDIKIMNSVNCDYCLDISHAFMCATKEKDILNQLSKNINLVKHIHIAGASGIDGEGESLKKMDKDQAKFFKEIINLPLIKVIEVWQ